MIEQTNIRIPGKSIKIGYLLHNMLQSVSMEYFNGTYQAAYDNNINLIIEGIGGHYKNNNEQYDINFSMLNILGKDNFDGLIIWGSVLNSLFFRNNQDLMKFLDKYKNIPTVNIGLQLFNNPTVLTDNIEGLKKMLKHLIKDHGYTNIAYIRGPENHYSDIQRYKTFINTLEEYGLPVNYDLITPPTQFKPEQFIISADYIIKKIKKKELIPGKNLDVIVAANDFFAHTMMDELKKIGLRIPEDIAVTGFDNINESRIIEPNLTTVDSNLFQIGYKALELLLSIIDKKEVSIKEIYMPSELIIRRSCGCEEHSLIKENKINPGNIINNESSFKNFINKNFKYLIKEKLGSLDNKNLNSANLNLILKLFDHFILDLTQNTNDKFITCFDQVLNSALFENEAVISLQKIFAHLWSLLTLDYNENDFKNKIYELLYQGNANITKGINTFLLRKIESFFNYAKILRNINLSISNNFDTDQILSKLEEILKELNIPDCCLFIFNELGNYLSPPKLIFSYKKNKRLDIKNEIFNIKEQFLHYNDEESNSGSIYLFDTLSFKDQPIGYILFNIKGIDNTYIGYIYDVLTSIISSSYYGAIILDEIKKAEKEKENFLKVLANQNIELKKAIESANNANKAKSSFLANISHEIRTPLTVITGLAEKIQYIQDKFEQQKYSDLIINETKKITELINQLLDISIIEAGKLKIQPNRLNLKKMMRDLKETYQVIAQKKGLKFNLVLDENIPLQVMGDEMRIRQVIINLVGNAIKFTEKGDITITAEIKSQDQEKISILFKVIDTGIGIPEEKHNIIFELFRQSEDSISSRYGGTGLGTTIAKQLIELMGGEIGVNSTIGEGSTFWFNLCFNYVYNTKKSDNNQNKSFNNIIQSKDIKKSILFIEDNIHDLKSTLQILQKAGYNIDTAGNCDEIKFKILMNKYNLVILDLNYQKKYNCMKFIKINIPSVPILIISDKKEADNEIELLDLGADYFIVKPYNSEEFLARASSLLRRKNDKAANIIIADLEIDKNLKKVKRGEKIISLTPKEYCLLEFLAENKNTIMNKLAISEYLWGQDTDLITLSHNIDVHIKNLRKKIDSTFDQKILLTKRGMGVVLTDKNNLLVTKN